MNKKSGKNSIFKFLFYISLLLILFYFISHLNMFPGAVDYQETEETTILERGEETYVFNQAELDTSELLRLSILKIDIDTLQHFLIVFTVFIPFSLFFFIERDTYKFFNLSKTLKTLIILLIILTIFVFLIMGYTRTLESIDQNIGPLITVE